MDFEDSPAEAAFRAEARKFLEEHAPETPIGSRDPSTDRDDRLERARRWQRTCHEHGWAALMWPKEFGGRGAGPIEAYIWEQELAQFSIGASYFVPGVGMAGPTIIAHGTEAQKQQHLMPMLRGELFWCQLFSEPSAGSDLAALGTRAIRDGDDWLVSGQKVWSSFADKADWGFLLARTDPARSKRDGITYFLLDMKTPGIHVRPIKDSNGGIHFNEVFFDQVRIPDAQRMGEINGGWAVTRTTLMHERMAIGSASSMFSMDDLLRDIRNSGVEPDAIQRQQIAQVYLWNRSLELLNARVMTKLSRGEDPTTEASVMKLALARLVSAGADAGLALDPRGAQTGQGHWAYQYVFAPALHIAGGTDEIQRNIIAERVLGLPREPDPFKETAFEDLPRS